MTTFYFLSGENLDWFAHAGANNTTEVDFVVVAILVLITLAHLHKVASQVLAGNSEPVSPERRYPTVWRPDICTRKQELETRSTSAVILVGEVHKGVF